MDILWILNWLWKGGVIFKFGGLKTFPIKIYALNINMQDFKKQKFKFVRML